jgi:hypothetical protein
VPSNFHTDKFVGTRNETLASKVALMKLKQSARGPSGVPMENRRHVFVKVENEHGDVANNRQYPFYLSKLWPLGKALDYLTNELKLLPMNRVIFLENAQISLDLSSNIEHLEQLHDADVIVLKRNKSNDK